MPQNSTKFIPLDDSTSSATPVATPASVKQPPSSGKFIPLTTGDFFGGAKGNVPQVNLGKEGETEFSRQVSEGAKETGKSALNYGLPLVLGTIGSLAGPAGTATGATTGTLMAHTLTKEGDEPLTPGEALKDIAFTAPSTYTGARLLGPIEGKVVQSIAGALFQRGVKGVNSAVRGEPIFPDSVGSEAGDFAKDFGTNLGITVVGGKLINKATGSGKQAGEPFSQVMNQTREATITPGPTSEAGIPPKSSAEYGSGAQRAIRGNLARAKGIEKAAFDEFRSTHIEGNTETLRKLTGYEQGTIVDPNTGKAPITPKFEDVKVKGPIYTANTQQFAQEVLPDLDGFMKGEAYQKLPPVSQAKYAKLYSTVKDLATPFTSVDAQGNPVEIPIKEFETVKDVRTDINRALGGKPAPNFPEAGLKKLSATLGQDIDNSINNFWKNGSDASASLAKANKATEFKKQVFNREIQTRLYGKYESGQMDTRTPADPSEVFKDAYRSPEKAQRLMTAMGPDNAGYIKGDYFDNVLMKKAFGPDLSKFNPDAITSDLENPNSVSRVILNADERNNLLRFARAARTMGDESGGGALSFNQGRFSLNLGLGVSRLLTGSTMPGRIVIGAKQFLEATQQNKLTSDLASRLIKVRPDQFEAQQNTKLLMRGLRGSEVVFVNPNGEEKKGNVNEAGKIVF